MDPAERDARADANYFESMRLIARYAPEGEIVEHDGLAILSSGLPVAALNMALVTRTLAAPGPLIAEAAAYFNARHLRFILRVREGVDPRFENEAESLGFPYSDSVPNLALEDIAVRGSFAEGLEIRLAATPAALQDHATVCAAAFGMPMYVASALVPPAILEVPGVEIYVGYRGGSAVASAALILSHGVAGIFNVGALSAVRRQGIGEAMTWHAVRRGAAQGALFANLQASEMGRPIYERMGFRLTANYRTFHHPGA